MSPANGFELQLPTPVELSTIATRIARLVHRPAEPILNGVLLTATDSGLQAAGYNYETALTRTLDADVRTPGTVLVSAKLLADITRTMPAGPVTVAHDEDEKYLRVQCGSTRARLPLLPVEDYPQLPTMPEITGETDGDALANATTQVAHATNSDDILQISGAFLQFDRESLWLQSTDRYRLARVGIAFTPTLSNPDEHHMVRIEHAPLHEAAKSARGQTIRLAVTDNRIGLITSHEQLILRQLDNTAAPMFDQARDRVDGEIATVTVDELAGALRRAQVYDDKAVVAVDVTQHEMTITTTSDLGDNVDTLSIAYTGPDSRFGINPTYLGAAVAALDADLAAITVPPKVRTAMQLAPLASDGTPRTDHIQIVMPTRIIEEAAA